MWLDQQPAESVWTTAITVFEIRFGLDILPPSRRKNALQGMFEKVLAEDITNRILNLDQVAATAAAKYSAKLRSLGKTVKIRDVMIMGIAEARRGKIVTRNVRHFAEVKVGLINPWQQH